MLLVLRTRRGMRMKGGEGDDGDDDGADDDDSFVQLPRELPGQHTCKAMNWKSRKLGSVGHHKSAANH
eukprot:920960-Pyramimonas_sp.AAC.1